MENVVWGEENRILRIESMNKWWTVYMYAIYACTSMSHHIQPQTFTHKRTSYLKWTWNNICLAHAASCKPTKKRGKSNYPPEMSKTLANRDWKELFQCDSCRHLLTHVSMLLIGHSDAWDIHFFHSVRQINRSESLLYIFMWMKTIQTFYLKAIKPNGMWTP